jgi:hypothetical protein
MVDVPPTSLLNTVQTRDGASIVLTCSGSAETEALEKLQQALDSVHADAMKASAPTVIADVRAVEFASSSCLKVFVSWLQRVQQLEDERRYKVVFRSDLRHSWQRRSLGALAAFAAGIVELRPEAA